MEEKEETESIEAGEVIKAKEDEEEMKEIKKEEVKEEGEVPKPEVKPERRLKKRGLKKIPEYLLEKEAEKADSERLLTIKFYPKLLTAPKWKRAKKAAKILKELVVKYVKYATDPETGEKIRINRSYVWISPRVNEKIWSRGAKNPPRKLRVRVLVKFINIDRRGRNTEAELRVMPL